MRFPHHFLIALAMLSWSIPFAQAPVKQSPAGEEKYDLVVSGSETIGNKLVPELLKAFLKEKGFDNIINTELGQQEHIIIASNATSSKKILVKSHGSSTGFTDYMASKCDVIMSSRKVESSDYNQELLVSKENEHMIALDAVAVIVHKSNDIRQLTMEDLANIFMGNTKDWSQIDKAMSGPIHVFSRDEKSGTFEFFKTKVFGKGKLVTDATIISDNEALSTAVAQDPKSIGFVTYTRVGSTKVVKLTESEGDLGYMPTMRTILSEDYPLTRRLYLYAVPEAANRDFAMEFINFTKKTESARKTILDQGLVPPQPDLDHCATCNIDGEFISRIFTNPIRFMDHDMKLDSKGYDDVKKIIDVLDKPEYKDSKIYIVGYADDTKIKRYNNPKEVATARAELIAREFESYGITPQKVVGLGEVYPAPSPTKLMREKNCKVEIWLK